MNKIGIIIFREYWTRVRKRSFLLTTFLAPLGFAMFFVAAILISSYTEGEKQIAVIDESGEFDFKKRSLKTPSDKSVYFKTPVEDYSLLKDSMSKYLYDAVVRIPPNFEPQNPNKIQIQVLSDKRLGLKVREALNSAFSDQVSNLKLKYLQIDRDLLDDINEDLSMNYTIMGEEDEDKGFGAAAAVLGVVMGFAIYISLFIYGGMVMKGVMEEKTNRIVEVILSSVKPFQLLLAKIIGIGAVGITQYLLWGVLIFGVQAILTLIFGDKIAELTTMSPDMQGADFDPEEGQMIISTLLSQFNFWKIGLLFLFYYLGGYLLYGALFAAIGSAANDDGDLQSLTFPISIPIIISIFFLFTVIQDPEGKLALWTSLVPFSSPIIMPARLAFDPPVYQIILSMVFLILGFLFTTWIAARVYKTGILMYGKKVTLKELVKWVFHTS